MVPNGPKWSQTLPKIIVGPIWAQILGWGGVGVGPYLPFVGSFVDALSWIALPVIPFVNHPL